MVDREIKTPLYIQVYNALLETITMGRHKGGEILPSEKDMALTYNVDRQTIRRSLELLVNDGLVEKRAGVGSFVREHGKRVKPADVTGTFAFVLPGAKGGMERIAEPFNAKLFSEVEKQCRRESFYLTYTTLNTVADLDRLPGDVIGIFSVSHVDETIVAEIVGRSIPVVVINNYHPGCISILEDSLGGAEAGVNHLLTLGHRRIGYIGGIQGYVTSGERFTGYVRSLINTGLDWQNMPIQTGDWTFNGGYKAMQEILRTCDEPPTAVFAANDMMALGAMDAVRNEGISIPREMSFLGFDDIDQCRYTQPTLSTIGVDIELTARVAAVNIMRLLSGGIREAYRIIIPTTLVPRGSTVPPGT